MAKMAAGSAGAGLRGRVAGLVYRETAQGTVVQAAPTFRRATSAKEILVTEQTAYVAGLWNRLTPEAMGRWSVQAALLKGKDSDLGASGRDGYLLFSALGRTILRVDRARPIPDEPPAGRFLGDLVAVTAEASGGGDPTPAPPQGEGIFFRSDRANAPGVVTELLTQPLANGARKPKANGYRSRGFVAFAGAEAATVAVDPGWHACATRFVEAATGRSMGLLPCGVVRVD